MNIDYYLPDEPTIRPERANLLSAVDCVLKKCCKKYKKGKRCKKCPDR